MLDALQVPPGHEDHGHPEPAEALKEIRDSGRENMLKQDLRMRKALESKEVTISELKGSRRRDRGRPQGRRALDPGRMSPAPAAQTSNEVCTSG